jgi:YHS domain-containing protein
MSIYLSIDGEEAEQVASNQGWSDLTAWADTQDAPELAHLLEYGWTEPASALAEELVGLDEPNQEDVKTTLVGLVAVVGGLKDEVVTVTNGVETDEDDDPEDSPDPKLKGEGFDPSQPRDDHGRWGDTGQGGDKKKDMGAEKKDAVDDIDTRKPKFGGETYYHGSNTQISQFDDRPTSFSTNETHARDFGEHLHAVQLDVRKPIDISHLGSGAGEGDEMVSGQQIKDALAEHGIDVPINVNKSGWTSNLLRPHLPEIIRQGRANGFDGLKLGDFKSEEAAELMPFSPKQVKITAVNGEPIGGKKKKTKSVGEFAAAFRDAHASGFRGAMDDLIDDARSGKYGPDAKALIVKHSQYGSNHAAVLQNLPST